MLTNRFLKVEIGPKQEPSNPPPPSPNLGNEAKKFVSEVIVSLINCCVIPTFLFSSFIFSNESKSSI